MGADRMNMDLIKAFAVLGELCHFGDAARALGVSQPSLTKQIRRLEDMLGAALFRRSRQGTELTALGRRFLDDVQPVLRLAENVWEKGLRGANGERGQLALGFTFSAVAAMASVLKSFQKHCPEVTLLFDDVASEIQIERIVDGALDVGFVRMPVGPELAHRQIATDRLCFLHPAAWGQKIKGFDSASLRHVPFIGLKTDSSPGLERHIQSLFLHHGFEPRIIHRVSAALTVLSMVAEGLGVALLHESAIREAGIALGGIVAHPVEDECARWDVALAWRHDEANPTVLRFLHEARQILGGEAQDWNLPALARRRRKPAS